jgi:hypothetical protein
VSDKKDERRNAAETVQFKLRIKEGLRAKIEDAASKSGGSMNTEIAARLEESLREDEQFGGTETRQAMVWLANDIAKIERVTGKSWTEDPTTFEAVALTLGASVERRRPRPENYDEAQEFIGEMNEKFERRTQLITTLIDCGAMIMVQPNALAALVNGGPVKPYPEPQTDESKWYNPTQPNEPMDEQDKNFVRSLLAEVKEISTGADGATERIEELMKPTRLAQERGRAIYEEHKRGFEDMLKRATEAASVK